MRKIFAIGETVLDIVFKENQPIAAKAGGSTLNTSVSLGRLGLPISFISEYGTDRVGKIAGQFLSENGVDTSLVYQYSDGKSSLALAFLDEKSNASYDFYKIYPGKRLEIVLPEINPDDLVIFGSFFALTFEVRRQLKEFIQYAKSKGALVIYDPNFRKSHLNELPELKPVIFENMAMADIIRCSDEDMDCIFGVTDADSAYEKIKPLCSNMIYTCSSKAVFLRTPLVCDTFAVKKIEPVSTIGAGDNFNAGVLYGLYNFGIGKEELFKLTINSWQKLIDYGIDFASDVCLSLDNYISEAFARKIINGAKN